LVSVLEATAAVATPVTNMKVSATETKGTVASDGRFVCQLFDWKGLLGHKRPTGMISIFGALAFHCHYKAEEGALALSEPLPGNRA
jgi:hypothetical protein